MFATTKMSSKGQIVIPKSIREQLNLAEGTQFVVIGKDNAVILQAIPEIPLDEFEILLQEAQEQARQVGLEQADIDDAVKEARGG